MQVCQAADSFILFSQGPVGFPGDPGPPGEPGPAVSVLPSLLPLAIPICFALFLPLYRVL